MGGIGSIIGALSFLGFLLFLAGIGLVVMSVSQGRPVRNGVVLAVAGLIAGILLSIVSQGILIVQPTEAAVVFNVLSGELEEPPRLRGTHIIIPVIQETTIYPISQQSYTMSEQSDEGQRRGDDAVSTRSFDGQEILMDVTTIFQIDETQVNQVHVDWNTVPGGYIDGFIRPTVRSVVRDIVADFEAEAIYAGGRVQLQTQIETVMREELSERGFTLTSVLIRNITFAPQFATAIEEKQIEEQRLQRAQTEAERVETEAEGQANAVIAKARGDAEAVSYCCRSGSRSLTFGK